MKSTTIGAALCAAVLALTAACAGTQAPAGGAAPPSASAEAHNAADVAFAQGMVPHHQQAVAMAQLAIERSSNAQVKQLATRIGQAQGPEIEQMQGFLRSWGVAASATPGNMGGMDHGSTGGMPGMMTDAQMTALGQASGAEFDTMFLQMMVDHHKGAVEMANTELKGGQNPAATDLAKKIVDAQRAEIDEMGRLLSSV